MLNRVAARRGARADVDLGADSITTHMKVGKDHVPIPRRYLETAGSRQIYGTVTEALIRAALQQRGPTTWRPAMGE